VLRLLRSRPKDDYDSAVNDLIEAVELDPGDDGRLTAEVHISCRTNRATDSERFDALWTARLGELPAWLLLDRETQRAVTEWLATPTWEASREFLIANEAVLLSDAGRTALGELSLANPGSAVVAHHVAILEAPDRDGIDAAYEAPLAGETAVAWAKHDDLEESKQFLLEHGEHLLTPVAVTLLAERGHEGASALLNLAISSSVDLAYELFAEPGRRESAMASAAAAGEFQLLGPMASFCALIAEEEGERALALAYLAVALAASGETARAKSVLEGISADSGPLITVITSAISAHSAHAADLASLIDVLNQQPPPKAAEPDS
jgi:hypothetical protein